MSDGPTRPTALDERCRGLTAVVRIPFHTVLPEPGSANRLDRRRWAAQTRKLAKAAAKLRAGMLAAKAFNPFGPDVPVVSVPAGLIGDPRP